MIEIRATRLPGCFELQPDVHRDRRGSFVKPYVHSVFEDLGLSTTWRERFYSQSVRGVIRGLHLQEPPAVQDTLVHCVAGSVFDAVVDLRAGSPTFGEFEAFTLDASRWTALYVPVGFAHGFAVLSADAVMTYTVSAEHNPACDTGPRWDSVDIPWPVDQPVVSGRDAGLPSLADYATPFVYEGGPRA